MLAFILRRLLQGIIVMLVVGFIAFSLFNFVGDPVSLMLPPEATQADREQMRQSLGLDKPFYAQFATFLGNAVQGNFGISLRLGRPVSTLLIERLPWAGRTTVNAWFSPVNTVYFYRVRIE